MRIVIGLLLTLLPLSLAHAQTDIQDDAPEVHTVEFWDEQPAPASAQPTDTPIIAPTPQPQQEALAHHSIKQLEQRIQVIERMQSQLNLSIILRRLAERITSGQPYRTEWVQFRSQWLAHQPDDATAEWLDVIELAAVKGVPTQWQLLQQLHHHKGSWLASRPIEDNASWSDHALHWLSRHIRIYSTAPTEDNSLAALLRLAQTQLQQQQWAALSTTLDNLNTALQSHETFNAWHQQLETRIRVEQALETSWTALFSINETSTP